MVTDDSRRVAPPHATPPEPRRRLTRRITSRAILLMGVLVVVPLVMASAALPRDSEPGTAPGAPSTLGASTPMPMFVAAASVSPEAVAVTPDGSSGLAGTASPGISAATSTNAPVGVSNEAPGAATTAAPAAGSPPAVGPAPTPAPTPKPTPAPTPKPTIAPTPKPTTVPAPGCDATFTTAPSTSSDQSSSITSFLRANEGRHVCFAADAVYRVDGRIELDDWSGTIDGRGATFRRFTASTSQGEHFRIVQGRNVVIENLDIRGPATLSDIQNRTYGGSDRQDQHAFSVESTVGFTLRNATLTGIWGDGVNVRARNGGGIDDPSSKVLISSVTMDVIGRNGIGIISVDGLTVRSVKINHAALHAIDGEPNRSSDVLANIVIESSDLRNFDAGHTPSGPGWAVVLTPGYANVLPTNVVIRNNTMDKPRVRVDGYDSSHLARNVSVTGNRPSVAGSAVFQHVQGLTFSDNGLMDADTTDVH